MALWRIAIRKDWVGGVKPYMIKVVMATIMLIVAVSRTPP